MIKPDTDCRDLVSVCLFKTCVTESSLSGSPHCILPVICLKPSVTQLLNNRQKLLLRKHFINIA